MAWTTGPSGVRCGSVGPPVVPGVERSESFGLDVKEGRGLGQGNGERGPGPATVPRLPLRCQSGLGRPEEPNSRRGTELRNGK